MKMTIAGDLANTEPNGTRKPEAAMSGTDATCASCIDVGGSHSVDV